MPDKECTTNLLELSFSLGQLRADKTKPREFLGEMSAILDGWECRKSGDDGDAFDALQKAIDSGSQGRGDNISKNQMDTIWREYHSLMMAMGYLDLDLVGQPKRAPIPNTGIIDGNLVVDGVRLKSGGFTNYRTVKAPKETTAAPTEGETTTTTTTTDKPKRPGATSGYILFSSACKATEQVQAIVGFGAKTTACADQWNALPPRQQTTWKNRATKANDAARAAFEAEAAAAAAAAGGEAETSRWGYNNQEQRRGASRWTPQNARNSILQ
jgi:hypothetical protein